MQSIYRISSEQDFPFNSNFDYGNIEKRIMEYHNSNNKTQEWYSQLMRDVATCHCFRELRILLIKKLENNE